MAEGGPVTACELPRWDKYNPYVRQMQFHSASRKHRERLFMAGNQLGKTLAGAMETAIHLRGIYPDWWRGRVFKHPPSGWAAGVTIESTRDTIQRLLFGRLGREDSGVLRYEEVDQYSFSAHLAGTIDRISVHHASGGFSTLSIKSYEKGRERWQARRSTSSGSTRSRPWTFTARG
jgi:hypothetical protein